MNCKEHHSTDELTKCEKSGRIKSKCYVLKRIGKCMLMLCMYVCMWTVHTWTVRTVHVWVGVHN